MLISLAFLIAITVFGVPLAVADFREHRLPNALTGALLLTAISIVLSNSLVRDRYQSLKMSAFGGLISMSFYLLVALVSRGGLGVGDIKLAAPVGVISGFYGLQMLWTSTCFAILSAALFALGLITSGRAKVKSAIPFGPFMLLGQLLCLLFFAPSRIY